MGYKKDVIRGASWLFGLRLFTRAVTFIRTIILARILSPAQFGVYGVAALALGFLEIVTQTGINIFLVQEKNKIDKYVDTAWVVSIIRGFIIGIVIVVGAPIVSNYFNSSDSKPILQLISLVAVLRGFINPSKVLLQKNLQFKKEFKLHGLLFVVDAIVAIIVSTLLRSPIGIVYGMLAGVIVEIILSFVLFKPIPRISFNRNYFVKVIKRGKWVTLSHFFSYLSQQGDDAIVGKLVGSHGLGIYQVAYKISTLPLTEITQVTGKVLFPVYTRIVSEKKRLRRAFLSSLLTVVIFVVPFGTLMILFPVFIVRVFLGLKWIEAAYIIRVLAIFGIVRACIGIPNSLFLSLKKQKWISMIQFIQMIGLLTSIFPLIATHGLKGAAYASVISVIVSFPFVLHYTFKALRI